MKIQVVLPECPVDAISEGMRELTATIRQHGGLVSGGLLGGEDGYGGHWDSDIFMMHPYCWCENEGCPWCVGCDCEASYWIGNIRYNADKFYDLGGFSLPNAREQVERQCEFCKTGDVAASKGGETKRSAPNFWHKPSGLKVWWYKYIGRGMEHTDTHGIDFREVIEQCKREVSTSPPPVAPSASSQ